LGCEKAWIPRKFQGKSKEIPSFFEVGVEEFQGVKAEK
jgi:hypothetical protein